MRLHIPSFITGTLLGFFLLFGTLAALSQSKNILNLQGEEIQTTIQIGSESIPATIIMDLEILLNENAVNEVAIPTESPGENNDIAEVDTTIAGTQRNFGADGSPNLVRNLTSPTDTGLNITSPHIAFDKETELLTFGTEIGMLLNIHSINAKSKVAGEGIKQVIFRVTDLETNEIVYSHQESSSLYCLFGGDTVKECAPKTFVELDNRWPSSKKWIYNGDYNMNVYIITEDDYGDWNFPIRIQGGVERPRKTNSYSNSGG